MFYYIVIYGIVGGLLLGCLFILFILYGKKLLYKKITSLEKLKEDIILIVDEINVITIHMISEKEVAIDIHLTHGFGPSYRCLIDCEKVFRKELFDVFPTQTIYFLGT